MIKKSKKALELEAKRQKQLEDEKAKEAARNQLIADVLGEGIPHVGPPYVDRLGGNLFVLNRLDLKTVLRKVRVPDEVIEEAARPKYEKEPEDDVKQRLFKLALPFYGKESNLETATDKLAGLARLRKIWTPPCPEMIDRGQNAQNDRPLLRGLAEATGGDTHKAAEMLQKMVKWEYQMQGRIQVGEPLCLVLPCFPLLATSVHGKPQPCAFLWPPPFSHAGATGRRVPQRAVELRRSVTPLKAAQGGMVPSKAASGRPRRSDQGEEPTAEVGPVPSRPRRPLLRLPFVTPNPSLPF